ncbi:hypothetical protein [Colwellia sp. MB02u-9]|uniref:hypothetical protein n=1 Tax=Colwellia sp. MB02u-9 TaxID=2759823 RepID=UPI0015F538C3|nr:hypothetical protein [Colwellia sp. MB02u-9]MBA6296645.1 hypothetical protein [Colwellia sp. MB02u-9]
MSVKLDWVLSLQRIGVSFCTGDGILGVLQTLNEIKAGINSNSIENRLRQLEDPISCIHSDVPSVAAVLYIALEDRKSTDVTLTDRVFDKYRRPLTMLNAENYIEFDGAAGSSYPDIIMGNPYFIIYSAALNNKNHEMNNLVAILDNSANGLWLEANDISQQVKLPVQVINAFFEVYSARGLGDISKMDSTYKYHVLA